MAKIRNFIKPNLILTSLLFLFIITLIQISFYTFSISEEPIRVSLGLPFTLITVYANQGSLNSDIYKLSMLVDLFGLFLNCLLYYLVLITPSAISSLIGRKNAS
ncbi:MAG: hypothetical protein ACK5JF_00390 [Oscillospiraceae bacterium]